MNIPDPTTRRAIWLYTAGVAIGFAVITYLVHALWIGRFVDTAPLSLALSFAVTQITAVLVMLAILFILRRPEDQAPLPAIRRDLARFVAGDEGFASLKRLNRAHASLVERCILEFLSSITVEGRQRLSKLALDLGFVRRWKRQFRSSRAYIRRRAVERLCALSLDSSGDLLMTALQDPDEAIRIMASRSMARSGERHLVERVFAFSLTQPLLIRALLVEDLRPHAVTLAQRAIPKALASPNPVHILIALEFAEAWRKALPLRNFAALLTHPNPEIRSRALRVLPHLAATESMGKDALAALNDPDERIVAAAAFACARLRLHTAIPSLADCLRRFDGHGAIAAAYALAELGPDGMSILEQEVLSPRRTSASAALEAIEQFQTGHYDYAWMG